MGKRFGNFDLKTFVGGIAITLLAFQIFSIILSQWFPTFENLLKKFQIAWMWLILGGIFYLVVKLIYGMKSFDRKSIFIMFISIGIMFILAIYVVGGNWELLFDMSLIKSQLASIIP